MIYTRRSKHLLRYASSHPGSLTNKYTLRRCIRRIPLYQNVWRSRLVVGIDAVISRLFSTLTGVRSSSSRIARTVHKSSVRSDAGGLGFKIRDPAYVHKNSCVDVLHRCGLKTDARSDLARIVHVRKPRGISMIFADGFALHVKKRRHASVIPSHAIINGIHQPHQYTRSLTKKANKTSNSTTRTQPPSSPPNHPIIPKRCRLPLFLRLYLRNAVSTSLTPQSISTSPP